MLTALPTWARLSLAATGGAVLMIALGQVASWIGSNCTILCQPIPAAIYGAGITLLMFHRDLRAPAPPVG